MKRSALWVLAGAVAGAVAGTLLWSLEPDYATMEVATAADLERELDALRERLDIPGMSAAIAEGDRIIWARGFGYADVDRRIRVDPHATSFHLASVTKPYTATVILQLVDEGRLNLDSPVSRFGVEMPEEEPVRVWHLLSHTSAQRPGSVYRYDARAFGELTTVVERVSERAFATALTDRIVRVVGLAQPCTYGAEPTRSR
jgi:CubicO group peptidase (beta-lactamase class C family)